MNPSAQPPPLYAARNSSSKDPPPVTFSPSTLSDHTTEALRAEFGRKYDDIVNRYGAVDFVYADAGKVLDVVNPEEYLAEVDNRILHAVETGSDDLNLVPTSQLLHRQARSEVSFLHSITTLLRSEPQHLRYLILSNAQHRRELVPDRTGAAPKVEDLLKNSDFLATEVRYTIHNNLLVLGQLVLAEKLLNELVEHEEDVGYVAASDRRQTILTQAADLVQQAMSICLRRVSRILVRHTKFQELWVREYNYEPKWTGAKVTPLIEHPNAMQLYQSRTLDGALYRLSLEQEADPITLADFFSLYSRAAPEEIHGLGDYLVENISQLRAFFNFYSLLNMPKRSEHLKNDPRLITFKKNSERAQKILDAAAIERHIKNIDSLEQEKTLQKVWKEFDSLSQKREKKSIETLIGYEKLPPRWWIPPRIVRSRPAPPPNTPSRSLPLRPRNETIPVQPPEPPVEHEPVRLTPISYLSDARPGPVEEPSQRTEPKVKTTGVPNAPPSGDPGAEDAREDDADGQAATSVFDVPFHVKKWVYEVFEMLFDPSIKGNLKQGDFISAMCSLGWQYIGSSAGSRACLVPPIGNQPLFMHIKHGGDGDKMSAGYEHDYAKRLTEDYGFTLASFRIKE